VVLLIAACSTSPPTRPTVSENAELIEFLINEELKRRSEAKEAILVDVPFPSDCRSKVKAFPPGKTTFNVGYVEPKTNQNGKNPNLAYTTVYLRSPNGITRAIRVPSDDPNGGAKVYVKGIPVSGSELELCVTATNQYGKESLAAAWEPAR
jgi:hypothetical protein